jgi:membrane associated rhomboid family serine protease
MKIVSVGPFVKIIAAANILVAVIMMYPPAWEAFMVAGALFPARLFADNAVFARSGFMLPAWLTPISSAFLHGSFLHLAFNMLTLLLVAPNLERVLGRTNVAVLYCIGTLCAAAAQIASDPMSVVPIVGASGAISALLAAHVALFPKDRPKALGPISGRWAHAIKLMAAWIVVNLMLAFVGTDMGMPIAIWAHIGGFASGLLLVWPLMQWRYRNA